MLTAYVFTNMTAYTTVREENFLHNYFSTLAQSSFDKSKEAAVSCKLLVALLYLFNYQILKFITNHMLCLM